MTDLRLNIDANGHEIAPGGPSSLWCTDCLVTVVPAHDETTCTRSTCSRCKPSGKPMAPMIGTNPHQAQKPSPGPDVLQPVAFAASLDRTVRNVTSAMANMTTLAPRLRDYGSHTWQRVTDWELLQIPKGTPADEDDDEEAIERRRAAISDDQREAITEAAQAARYADELRTLLRRVAARQRLIEKATQAVDRDLARLDRLVGITNPDAPHKVLSKDMTAAQVAADGWCVSCFRDDQHLMAIAKRPNGDPFYRDLCRSCGEWQAENGELPPMEVLRTRHRGGRVRVPAK